MEVVWDAEYWDDLAAESLVSGLTLPQFWDSTFQDLRVVFLARAKRSRLRYEELAWHLAPILNMVSKRRISPRDLLPRAAGDLVDVSEYDTVEEVRDAIAQARGE